MHGAGNAITGGILFVVGLAITVGTAASGESVTIAYGAIIIGFVQMIIGISQMGGGDSDGYEPQPVSGHGGVNQDIELSSNARLVAGEFTMDDYPASALRAEAEGRVTVGFTVDTVGEVRDVSLLESSGNPALDQAACDIILDRFRYEPARKVDGTPVAQRRQQTVTWQLPAD